MADMTAQTKVDEGSVLRRLIDVGIALSAEMDHNKLMERILVEAKAIYNADGGTFYLLEDDRLSFAIMRNDSMGIAMGGTTGQEVPFPPLALHDPNTGDPNHHNVATHVALSAEVVNIDDAYSEQSFDFSGTKKFDKINGYRSMSFLTMPLTNYDRQVVGVLQLINARDEAGKTVRFDAGRQSLVEALAGQAAVALDNRLLLEDKRSCSNHSSRSSSSPSTCWSSFRSRGICAGCPSMPAPTTRRWTVPAIQRASSATRCRCPPA